MTAITATYSTGSNTAFTYVYYDTAAEWKRDRAREVMAQVYRKAVTKYGLEQMR